MVLVENYEHFWVGVNFHGYLGKFKTQFTKDEI